MRSRATRFAADPSAPLTATDARAIRLALGLTQRQLADRIGSDVMTISRWERGASPLTPIVQSLYRLLAREAGVKVRGTAWRPTKSSVTAHGKEIC